MKIGIIGGSGLEKLCGSGLEGESIRLDTGYGAPSAHYEKRVFEGCEFYFLNRHGSRHEFAPHLVNYRANIAGFKKLGVDRIVAFSSVGTLGTVCIPGDLTLLDNGVDFTYGRTSTFYDRAPVIHVDMTDPFCGDLRGRLTEAASAAGVFLRSGSVYVCTQGPRLETAAEIRAFDALGADVVGMTLFPEVSLAREAGLCYACVAVVTNFAAGVRKDARLTAGEITEGAARATGNIKAIINALPAFLKSGKNCPCSDYVRDAFI